MNAKIETVSPPIVKQWVNADSYTLDQVFNFDETSLYQSVLMDLHLQATRAKMLMLSAVRIRGKETEKVTLTEDMK